MSDTVGEQISKENEDKKEGTRRIVAFLDLIGFKNLLNQDKNQANELLKKYNEILSKEYKNSAGRPPYKAGERSTANGVPMSQEAVELINSNTISTFKAFIPFSDSLIILADEKDALLFVKQLSKFISHVYKQVMHELRKSNSQILPLFYRGGLAIGDAKVLYGAAFDIWNKNIATNGGTFCNAYVGGPAYVEAYGLEEEGIGPSLICSQELATLLSQKLGEEAVVITDVEIKDASKAKEVKQILWPFYACEAVGNLSNQNKEAPCVVENSKSDIEYNIETTCTQLLEPAKGAFNDSIDQVDSIILQIKHEKMFSDDGLYAQASSMIMMNFKRMISSIEKNMKQVKYQYEFIKLVEDGIKIYRENRMKHIIKNSRIVGKANDD